MVNKMDSKCMIIAATLFVLIQMVHSNAIHFSTYGQPVESSFVKYNYQPIYNNPLQYPSNIGYYPGISSPIIGQYPGTIFQYPIYGTLPIQGQIPVRPPAASLPTIPQGDAPPPGGVFLDEDTVSVDAAY